uniref:DUF4168 domain-containing protein n=1 Tax=Odontella aurita TaxID=265563 RepID=A0A7S4I7N6_9STRA|mmetsp:Transcript_21082/g.61287  ORF Transcript_21082/g.61287 Transcript_21082/m.61287 type:complete len:298 (+) Transcript_21082:90-983(+)
MRATRVSLAAFLAFATLFGRGASSTSRTDVPLSSSFRGGAEAAAAALPWSTGVGGDKNASVSSGSSVGGKTGKKKRRKRTTSSSSGSGPYTPSRARTVEGPAVAADISSSVGVPALEGGVAAADAVAAAAADSDVVDDALLVLPSKKSAKIRASSLLVGVPGKMPSLFISPEENMYDRYSACLAATEGLRKARDASLAMGKQPLGNGSAVGSDPSGGLLGVLRRQGKHVGRAVTKGKDDEEYKRACAQYVLQSSRVIRALGLSVSQFNQLGREVGNDPVLKERVSFGLMVVSNGLSG